MQKFIILSSINLLIRFKRGVTFWHRINRLLSQGVFFFKNLSDANDPDESGEVADGLLHHVHFKSPFGYQFSYRQRFFSRDFLDDLPIDFLESKASRESVNPDGAQPRPGKLRIEIAKPCH
jgi:hypothetical protein